MIQDENISLSSSTSNHDFLVMGTAEDAMKAKFATVQAGYYEDPYISAFRPAPTGSPKNQQPSVQVIIKRGTYARVACIFKAVSAFYEICSNIEPKPECAQVIVLGSGKDTSFFRILDERRRIYGCDSFVLPLHWFEVDHAELLHQKTDVICRSPIFSSSCTLSSVDDVFEVLPTNSSHPWHQARCYLLAHNLNLNPDELLEKLKHSGFIRAAPTLVILECVLMYMTKNATRNILSTLTNYCDDCTLVSYEPILGVQSSFGRVMQDNLSKIGLVQTSSCMLEFRTISHWLKLFSSVGFKRATSCDMHAAYETILSSTQRAHAQRCEFLDELEEFILIMKHYCLTVSSNNYESSIGSRLCEVSDTSILGFVRGHCEQL